MDENLNRGLHLPFQVSEDSNSIWPHGENSGLSSDFSYNHVGRHITSLDLSHSNQIRNVDGRTAEDYISYEKSRKASEDHNDDGTDGNAPLSNCEPDVGMLSRKGGVRDSEVYVWCLNPLRIRTNAGENDNQRLLGSKIENRKYADIAVGFGNCPNSGTTINELQASYGELLRVGTMGSVTWTNKLPRKACHLVLAHPCLSSKARRTSENQDAVCLVSEHIENDAPQQSCGDTLMVVDTFANEKVRRQVASTYGYELPFDSSDPIELDCYIKHVAKFGFNHIIIIGELDYGMVFIDCFGRVFQWEDMLQMLWPLYNYSSNKAYIRNNKFAWFVENDGVVYEIAPQDFM